MRVLIFNPRAATYGYRIPNSILQVAASIEGEHSYVLVDGNREEDPWSVIEGYLKQDNIDAFCCTSMPGPQLKQSIPFTKRVSEQYPSVKVIWGGYFASNQYKAVMNSGWVDYIIDGPGDKAFPSLLKAIEEGEGFELIQNLIFKKGDEICRGSREVLLDQDSLPDLPYEKLNSFYPIEGYLKRTFLGDKTAAYHSSMGCPFTCSFCAVVPIYNARWKGKSAKKIYEDVMLLRKKHGADAVEFHDNNFFVSEKRTVEFAKLIMDEKIQWWGEGRIDTMDKYSDESLQILADSGCKMIFFGAETGSDEVLKKMDKGGTQTGAQIKAFAERIGRFGIIPEYSFVLGIPGDSEKEVMKQIDDDIAFIKEVKAVNPETEIIIYVYSPVPTEGSDMYEMVKAAGFEFPETLEDWLEPVWEKFDMRKNPLTPWLTAAMVDKIQGFETVVNGRYPTLSDTKLTGFQRSVVSNVSKLRYNLNFYKYPYEIKALQKFWLKYRQPEVEGF